MMPWTKMHLYTLVPSYIVMFAIAMFLAKVLKDKGQFLIMLPVRLVAIILVIMEIFKQVLSINKGYSLHHLPLHFCSMFVLLFPLFSFYYGKYREHIKVITVVSSTCLLLFMIICPNTIFSDTSISEFFIDFFSFHTVAFHNMVLFGLFYIMLAGLYELDRDRDHKSLSLSFSIYCFIACVMSQVLKENFNGFYTCPITIFEEFRLMLMDKIGWVAQLIYIVILWTLTVLFGIMCYWVVVGVDKGLKKLREKH